MLKKKASFAYNYSKFLKRKPPGQGGFLRYYFYMSFSSSR